MTDKTINDQANELGYIYILWNASFIYKGANLRICKSTMNPINSFFGYNYLFELSKYKKVIKITRGELNCYQLDILLQTESQNDNVSFKKINNTDLYEVNDDNLIIDWLNLHNAGPVDITDEINKELERTKTYKVDYKLLADDEEHLNIYKTDDNTIVN